MKPSAIVIGLAAGFAAALLFAGVVVQSTLAILLSLVAPLPILIASLGWGSVVGFIAAVTAAVTVASVTGSLASGGLLFASISLPAALIGHVAGLARPNETSPGGLDWYPVSRILFGISAIVAVICLLVGWIVGYDPQAIGDELSRALATQFGPEAPSEQLDAFAHQVVAIIPFFQPALLVLVFVLCLYLAATVTRLSGRLQRVRDDLPTVASVLPRAALPVFGAALLSSFAPGALGTVGAVVAGSFGMAFTLAGLAAIHRMTRATRSRGLILFAYYMAVMILTFPLLVATIIGLSETARRPAAISS